MLLGTRMNNNLEGRLNAKPNEQIFHKAKSTSAVKKLAYAHQQIGEFEPVNEEVKLQPKFWFIFKLTSIFPFQSQ